MDHFYRSGLILLAGVGLLATAGAIHAILLEGTLWTALAAAGGLLLTVWGGYTLRADLGAMIRQRRGEIVLYTAGLTGILAAIAWLSISFPARIDMTGEVKYSLS
jgi:hypothetical protein